MVERVPLAWLQLTHEKLRLVAAVAGIAFAVVLILMQIGFQQALANSGSLVQSALRGDIFLTSRQYEDLLSSKEFSKRRLYQALAFDEVASVWPVYTGMAQWKNPEDLLERAILVIGADPAAGVIRVPAGQDPGRLVLPDKALFDASSRTEFGPIADIVRRKGSLETEVNGRKIQVIGLYQLGTSMFGINATMLTSDLNFLRIFPHHSQDLVEIGVIRLKPSANRNKVRDALVNSLPRDVNIETQEAFAARERNYWTSHTGVGYIFSLGMFMGFVVGAVIVYQILYTDVNDHLSEYATLKAVGYEHSYLASLVLKESLLLAIFGFLPGLAIAKVLYIITARATRLPMDMTPQRMGLVLVATLVMCSLSALLAIGKLRQADPADIF